MHFLLGKPSLSEHAKAYAQAKAILESARVELIEEEQAEDFAKDLASAVTKAG